MKISKQKKRDLLSFLKGANVKEEEWQKRVALLKRKVNMYYNLIPKKEVLKMIKVLEGGG